MQIRGHVQSADGLEVASYAGRLRLVTLANTAIAVGRKAMFPEGAGRTGPYRETGEDC